VTSDRRERIASAGAERAVREIVMSVESGSVERRSSIPALQHRACQDGIKMPRRTILLTRP
jgi:hypothetical protein